MFLLENFKFIELDYVLAEEWREGPHKNLLTKVRGKVEGWLNQTVKILIKLGFTATTLTVLGLCFSIVAAYFYAYPTDLWYIWVAAFFLFLAGFCDVLDGAAARMSGGNTSSGNFLDSLSDRYSDIVVIFGILIYSSHFVFFGVSGLVWGVFALVGSILVSYTRAKAETLNVHLEGVGLAERPERTIILIGVSLVLHPEWGLVILAILTHFTVIQRTIYTLKELKTKQI